MDSTALIKKIDEKKTAPEKSRADFEFLVRPLQKETKFFKE